MCIGSGWGFVGGWLLGCRNSAKSVLQKSELASLKQRTFVKQRRFPPAKNQLPSCRVSQNRCTLHGWLFRAGGIGWLLGSWMSRQRCAGRLVGEAEFACGLTVGVWGRCRCAGRQGGKAEFACGLTVGVWGRRRCAGRQGGKVGVPCDLMGVSE